MTLHVDMAKMAENLTWSPFDSGATTIASGAAMQIAALVTGKRLAVHGLILLPVAPTAQLFLLRSSTTVLMGRGTAPVMPALFANTAATSPVQTILLPPSLVPYQVGVLSQNLNLLNVSGAAIQCTGLVIVREV